MHQRNALRTLSRKHSILPIDFLREHRHALVLRGGTVAGDEAKLEEIDCLHRLGHDHFAVIGCERGVPGHFQIAQETVAEISGVASKLLLRPLRRRCFDGLLICDWKYVAETPSPV